MQYGKIKLSTTLLLSLIVLGLQAQEIVTATGGNALGSGGSVNYTIGQVFYDTNAGVNGSVAQGVQQPYEISILNDVIEGEGINLILSAYPNPTTNVLVLKVDDSIMFTSQLLEYRLFDIGGKLLEYKKIEENETIIDMKSLLPSIYLLKVTSNNKEVKTFKIIKAKWL